MDRRAVAARRRNRVRHQFGSASGFLEEKKQILLSLEREGRVHSQENVGLSKNEEEDPTQTDGDDVGRNDDHDDELEELSGSPDPLEVPSA